MTGCKPARSDDVVPFVNRPEGFLEGRVEHYATAVLFDGYAQPVLATTSAGRPIKLDGNPEHPAIRGGSTPFMQAAILDLYDPDRSQAPLRGGQPATWAEFDGADGALARGDGRANGGAGLRLLIGPTTSPTLLRQFAELAVERCRRRGCICSIRSAAMRGSPPGDGCVRLEQARGRRQPRRRSARARSGAGDARARLGAAARRRSARPSGCGCSWPRRRRPRPARTPTSGWPSRRRGCRCAGARGAVGVATARVELTDTELAWARQAAQALDARGAAGRC